MRNGAEGALMIKEAGLGICMMGKSGAFSKALEMANLVFLHILDAPEILLYLSVNELLSTNRTRSQ
jgi:soluble P-type ATPase